MVLPPGHAAEWDAKGHAKVTPTRAATGADRLAGIRRHEPEGHAKVTPMRVMTSGQRNRAERDGAGVGWKRRQRSGAMHRATGGRSGWSGRINDGKERDRAPLHCDGGVGHRDWARDMVMDRARSSRGATMRPRGWCFGVKPERFSIFCDLITHLIRDPAAFCFVREAGPRIGSGMTDKVRRSA